MTTDFSLPTNSTNYLNVLDNLKSRDESVAIMSYSGDSNIPTGAMKYNRTNRVLEEWDGAAWNEKRVEPPGIIKAYAGTSAPRGHLLCDGSVKSQTTYADLFAIVGSTFNTGGEGAGNFRLPNLQGRFPLGKATSGTGATLGETGGSIDHSHSVPAHYHSMGTGADLNITSSGTHTTTVDITHGHSASSVANVTGISATTSNTNVTVNDPGHSHNYGAKEGGSDGSSANRPQGASSSSGSNVTYTTNSATTGITLTNGNHSHTVNISDSGHVHAITVTDYSASVSDTNGAHTHNSGSFSGKIGLVTGGVDGNSAMTSGTANPPYLVVNYIITI